MTVRERQKLDPRFTFHFVSFSVLHVVFKQTLPKTNRSFHHVSSCAEFCCAML